MNKIIFVSGDQRSIKDIKFHLSHLLIIVSVFLGLIATGSYYLSKQLTIESKENEINKLRNTNKALQNELTSINSRIKNLQLLTYEIQRIDDDLRNESDLPQVDRSVRELGVGGSGIEYYYDENIDQSQKANLTSNKITLEELERQLKFELNSYKNLVIHFNSIEDSIKYLPLLLPLPEDQLRRISDKFGKRMHPILGVMKNHYGIDMSAPTGTPVYATADGYVDYASKNTGYGEFIRIRHKSADKNYGYETRYAHLSKYHVKRGDWVKRGDLIGEVGTTGLSSAPHLHYEVRFKGKPINPDEYYFLSGI